MTEWPLDRLLGREPRHTETEVLGWAKRLRHFYFMGEISSGQMELSEELQLRLIFTGRDDLLHVLRELGVLRYGVGEPPVTHTVGGETRVSEHSDLVQPGHCTLAGAQCFVWVNSGFLDVTCSANWRVSESNVADALRIEARIDALSLQGRVDRTLGKHPNCISVENFPELLNTVTRQE
jgi:hypothetical protein